MTWRVGIDRDLPIREGTWDADAAKRGVFERARNGDGEIIQARAKRAFLIYDDDSEQSKIEAGYKLPVAGYENGRLTVVGNALRNALARLDQVEDVPQDTLDRARSTAEILLAKLNERQGNDAASWTLDELFGFVERRTDRIVEKNGQFCATSADGTKNLGCYDTEDQARERLRQVEAAVAAKGDSKQWVSRCDFLGAIRYVPDGDEGAKIELELEPSEFAARLTPEGYLKIEGAISGTGVYEYSDGEQSWGELRTADEVFNPDSLKSFQMVPVTDDHPSAMVNADNIGQLQRGHLGSNVRKAQDGLHVLADMLITDPSLIKKIKEGKTQLSNGYEAIVVADAGVSEDGTPYSYRQTEIRGNHTAVVDQARGGPTCRLLFDAVGIPPEDKDMKVKIKDGKIMIGETEHEVPDEVAAAFEAMRNKVEEQGAELSKLAAEGDNKDEMLMEEEVKSQDSVDILKLFGVQKADDPKTQVAQLLQTMQGKIDALEASLKTEREKSVSQIDARVQLVTKAREILGADTKTDGVSDIALMKAVVGSVMPALKSKVDASKSTDYVRACYDAALEHKATKADSSEQLMELSFTAARGDNKEPDLDALYQQHCDSRRNRVEPQKEAN